MTLRKILQISFWFFTMAASDQRIITTPKLYKSTLPYSPGVLVDKTLYISGQLGWNVKGELAEGIEAQTNLALANMGHVLEVVGANHTNVVKCTVLLADLNDGSKMNAVYSSFFKDNLPARAAFQVAKLPVVRQVIAHIMKNCWKGALIEIEAIARIGEL